MKKNIKVIALLISLALIIGCVATNKTKMDNLLGQSKEQILNAWGVPDGAIDTKSGNTVMTWSTYDRQIKSICKRSLIFNNEDIVINWNTSGCRKADWNF